MKLALTALLMTLLLAINTVQAGVIVGGTRLIYDGGKKETSLSVTNPDKVPYLIQSWVDAPSGGADKAPFMLTPPLFRLNAGQHNVLRVVRTGGNLPTDKESLYWMNIKSIPAGEKTQDQNTLQIAVKTRIKMIYRPQELKGVPEQVTGNLTWQRSGNKITVTNPTPFYMNFYEIRVAGKKITDATYVAPDGSASFTLPVDAHGNNVTWTLISDYGGKGKEHTGIL
ncbi:MULTISPECIES: molecular chaperone [unclassified Serratia (in: enterobacteria)]|uniref:fimbrial biogenesis chaperone n=1 Tax=unclassified Serratia (in: enterobacteria) TaxID=2647522 RepID=UPI00046A8FEE|nr:MULTISPECIES: molecular chaperone [unclassified Serratia (in: enterobacteria)]